MAESPSKWVENTVGKGEIARYESHSVFKSLVLQTRNNQGLFGRGFNTMENSEGELVYAMF